MMTLAEARNTPLETFFYNVLTASRRMDEGLSEFSKEEDISQIDLIFDALFYKVQKFREIEEFLAS